jgi:hypothetical protein
MNIEMKEEDKPSKDPPVPVKTQTAEEKRKGLMMVGFKKLVSQMKHGCVKEFCFNKYC